MKVKVFKFLGIHPLHTVFGADRVKTADFEIGQICVTENDVTKKLTSNDLEMTWICRAVFSLSDIELFEVIITFFYNLLT